MGLYDKKTKKTSPKRLLNVKDQWLRMAIIFVICHMICGIIYQTLAFYRTSLIQAANLAGETYPRFSNADLTGLVMLREAFFCAGIIAIITFGVKWISSRTLEPDSLYMLDSMLLMLRRDKRNNMRVMVVIAVFNYDFSQIVIQLKDRGPFRGKWNLPGGKVESTDKSTRHTALKEGFEELGVTESDYAQFSYCKTILTADYDLSVYAGQLRPGVTIQQKESEKLEWMDVPTFLAMSDDNLAGYGDIKSFVHEILAMHILQN